MSPDPVFALADKPVSWLQVDPNDDAIAISTRIRLARNIHGYPFPKRASSDQRNDILTMVNAAVANIKKLADGLSLQVADLNDVSRDIMRERGLVSPELCQEESGSGLIISNDETCALLINEEDHLRLQVLQPGLQLQQAWEQIDAIDTSLTTSLPIAYDDQLGFLTACPTNLGTGMRASIMLHLPALALLEQMTPITRACHRLGMTIRGIYGEGSQAVGDFYQISNQSTLGESEAQILTRLQQIINTIIQTEQHARRKLVRDQRPTLYNHIGKAYGTLRYCYSMPSSEAIQHLSAVRLGVTLGILPNLTLQQIDAALIRLQPGHLQAASKKTLSSEQRDTQRATCLRNLTN